MEVNIMLSDKDLQELADFSSTNAVLSVFLNTELTDSSSEAHNLRLRNMLKNIDLPGDVTEIEEYYSHKHDRIGKGLVFYSCSKKNFFKTISLAIPVHDMVHVGSKPTIRPLIRLLYVYGYYGVILVDKQGSRLFHFHLGELHEQEGIFGESIKRVKRGGASSFPGRRGGIAGRTRAVEEQIERNMKDTVDFAEQFFKENHIRRLLIGGTDDNVAQFRNLLPKSWQSLVMGTFPMSMTANHDDVLEKALQVGKNAEQEREMLFVSKLIENAANDNNAVMGLDDTLDAINNSRVQTLIVAENYFTKGFICPNCEQLYSPLSGKICTSCDNSDLQPVEDIIDLAVSRVISLGGEVEVTQANNDLETAGKIGAFLRY